MYSLRKTVLQTASTSPETDLWWLLKATKIYAYIIIFGGRESENDRDDTVLSHLLLTG